MYYDDDMENEDTQYVLNQLQQSKASLEVKHFYNTDLSLFFFFFQKCYHQEME